MLEEGEVQVMGGFARYSEGAPGPANTTNDNYTLRITAGISPRTNLKIGYTRMAASTSNLFEYSTGEDVNYFEIDPKISLKADRIAFSPAVGLYIQDGGVAPVLSPKFYFTIPASDHFEVTFAPKADIYGLGGFAIGVTCGLGISSDLDKWAVRPEIGYMTGGFLNLGIGLTYNFSIK